MTREQPTIAYYGRVDRAGRPLPKACEGEADQAVFFHAAESGSRYLCEMHRWEPANTWCGYVYIPKDHPLFGASIDAVQPLHRATHGGVSLWDGTKVGFDCAHSGDARPGRDSCTAIYRTQYYAEKITRILAEAVDAMKADEE